MTATAGPRVLWVSARDGIAHARRRERDTRAICGSPAVPLAFAWPSREHCAWCSRAIAMGLAS